MHFNTYYVDRLITVDLEELHFFSKLGLYKEEEKIENEFKVNISLTFIAPENGFTSIKQTINYVEVYHIVKEELSTKKELLEACCMQITQHIYERFPFVQSIKVTIKKVSPPIVNFKGSVSVSYSRSFI